MVQPVYWFKFLPYKTEEPLSGFLCTWSVFCRTKSWPLKELPNLLGDRVEGEPGTPLASAEALAGIKAFGNVKMGDDDGAPLSLRNCGGFVAINR